MEAHCGLKTSKSKNYKFFDFINFNFRYHILWKRTEENLLKTQLWLHLYH